MLLVSNTASLKANLTLTLSTMPWPLASLWCQTLFVQDDRGEAEADLPAQGARATRDAGPLPAFKAAETTTFVS